MIKKTPYIISLLVIIALAWYYFIFSAFPISLGFINAVTAFSATIIISFSFFLGPLAKFINFFRKHLEYRKQFGFIGYSLAALHILLVVPLLLEETQEIVFADVVSIAVAAAAFILFTLMAFTSTPKWLEKLGYENWKNLQRTGYVALIFVLIHITLLEKGIFLTRTTGQIAISLILITIILRTLTLVFRMQSKDKITL